MGDGGVLHQAVDTCEGDMRRALTALQCCQRLLGKITAEGLIEVKDKDMQQKVVVALKLDVVHLLTFMKFIAIPIKFYGCRGFLACTEKENSAYSVCFLCISVHIIYIYFLLII